jgi:hypothetical protein
MLVEDEPSAEELAAEESERAELKAAGLCCALCCKREVEAVARAPAPCSPGCRGWDVFETGGLDDHLYETVPAAQRRARLNIQRCDECWDGVAGELNDEDYQAHPVCRAALARQVRRSNGS